MKFDGDDDPLATRSASPSAAAPTPAGEPPPGANRPQTVATQPRDPERYQVIGEHGRGGLGRVSRAHDRDLGRDIAIKELISRGHVSEVRFLREALITARLEHPGIVPVYEAGRWPDGTPFYAMKLVAGRPLRDLIAERQTVDERIGLLHHVIAVADAIAYAHGRNIIHRDLKPSNVIVGDFGETIVIDWGLAKDLSTTEESTLGGGRFRANRNNDLTATGSVLGTPAYMAPEQERGEHVDQRADVFAIGAMLWELCALQKVPPADPDLRHRILRRSGIDRDLITIIDKTLEPDPTRRYPDAGALAADLKAFKAGVRIAARSYSLLGLLAHWTRRHRALALTIALATAIAIAASALYVRNIAAARDQADGSEETARRAQTAAEASLDELTLKNAELLLSTDPSAALDSLAKYRGKDLDRASQIEAEAVGRGIAFIRSVPHTANVRWVGRSSKGTIISLSADGTIAQTLPDSTFKILTRGVSQFARFSYSSSKHLLAYTCDPLDLCLFDMASNTPLPAAPVFRGANPVGIAFSPNGNLLGLMSQTGILEVFDITRPSAPLPALKMAIDSGNDVKFLDNKTVVAGTKNGIEFIHLSGKKEASFSVPDNSYWDADPNERRFALATPRGHAFVFEGSPMHVAARLELCHGPIAGLQFVPGRRILAYACREGILGLWDARQNAVTRREQIEGHADLVAVSTKGDYVVSAGGKGTITILDMNTGLVASYKGHGSRLTSVAPPTPEYPFIISADVSGSIRAWHMPLGFTKTITTSDLPFHEAIFDSISNTVTVTSLRSWLTRFSPSTGLVTLTPHTSTNVRLERSDNGKFAAYGYNEFVELWSPAEGARLRVIDTGHGTVSHLKFIEHTDDIVTSGRDGRIVRWAANGIETVLVDIDQPIDIFVLLPSENSIVFASADGRLWRTDSRGRTFTLNATNSRTIHMAYVSNQHRIYCGNVNGELVAIDSRSWQQSTVLRANGAVQLVATSKTGSIIAVSTNDGKIRVATSDSSDPSVQGLTWLSLAIRSRHLALTPDGLLVAVTADGMIWLYSINNRRWISQPTGTADLRRVSISEKGDAAVVLDLRGRLIWVDLEAASKLLQFKNEPRANIRP